MHLERIRIAEFRNLKNFEISFVEGVDDPSVEGGRRTFNSHAVIGQNGTGKSNLIEAVITIFRDLDLNNVASFAYELDYKVRSHSIEIRAKTGKRPSVVIDGKTSTAGHLCEHSREYLPSHIFTYYSGKNERVEQLFQAHQRKFNQLLRQGKDDLVRRLFYCRGGHGKLVLLACLLSKDEVFARLLHDLNIVELDSALFVLKQPHYLKKELGERDILEGDNRFWYARGTVVTEFLDKLWQLAVAPIDHTTSKLIDFRGRTEKQEQIFLFLPDKEALEKLGKTVGPPERFFRYAEGAYIGDL
ncbi:MAG TPA: hypothetical protein PLI53_01145, partial [Geobacteraceae bacterium]|nr:hypothetical protein [Geobacteraceae bacterium]